VHQGRQIQRIAPGQRREGIGQAEYAQHLIRFRIAHWDARAGDAADRLQPVFGRCIQVQQFPVAGRRDQGG
jgi:hypothetical protein